MIGTLKLAGIAVLATAVAYVGGRWQGYSNGHAAGYAKKAQEIAANTNRANQENAKLEPEAEQSIRADEDRQTRVRLINGSTMQCVVTKEFAQRFAQ